MRQIYHCMTQFALYCPVTDANAGVIMTDGHFECKVSGRRESANGIFLTLQVQPDDYSADLAMLRVGSALMVGWSEVVDSTVHPIGPIGSPSQKAAQADLNKAHGAMVETLKPRTPFHELKLSQQCGIRCGDAQFAMFLVDEYPIASSGSSDPATVVRALCGVTSRADLDGSRRGREQWEKIESRYQQWLTDMRYKDSYR